MKLSSLYLLALSAQAIASPANLLSNIKPPCASLRSGCRSDSDCCQTSSLKLTCDSGKRNTCRKQQAYPCVTDDDCCTPNICLQTTWKCGPKPPPPPPCGGRSQRCGGSDRKCCLPGLQCGSNGYCNTPPCGEKSKPCGGSDGKCCLPGLKCDATGTCVKPTPPPPCGKETKHCGGIDGKCCERGLICDSTGICVKKTTTPPPCISKARDPCGTGGCCTGLTCSGTICLLNNGQSCPGGSTTCLSGYCDASSTMCKDPPAACVSTPRDACGTGGCCTGLTCSDTKCLLNNGQDCSGTDAGSKCLSGYCDSSDGKCKDAPAACVPASQAGQPCGTGGCCPNSGLTCSQDNKCLLVNGQDCPLGDTSCQSGVCGIAGRCIPPCNPNVGTACGDGCCCQGMTCFGGKCLRDTGGSCDNGSECLTGNCVSGASGGSCAGYATCQAQAGDPCDESLHCCDGMSCSAGGECKKNPLQVCGSPDECYNGRCNDNGGDFNTCQPECRSGAF